MDASGGRIGLSGGDGRGRDDRVSRSWEPLVSERPLIPWPLPLL